MQKIVRRTCYCIENILWLTTINSTVHCRKPVQYSHLHFCCSISNQVASKVMLLRWRAMTARLVEFKIFKLPEFFGIAWLNVAFWAALALPEKHFRLKWCGKYFSHCHMHTLCVRVDTGMGNMVGIHGVCTGKTECVHEHQPKDTKISHACAHQN